jgi:antirestriction protein
MNGRGNEPEGGERQPDENILRRAMPGAAVEQPPGLLTDRESLDEQPEPRIYVASVADDNAGRTHGRWIAADQPVEDIEAEIQEMLAESPGSDAEDWAIHEYEGFGMLRLYEHESLDFIREVADGIAAHGEAFAAFVDVAERDVERFFMFDGIYRGRWESVAAYAQAVLNEWGVEEALAGLGLPDWVQRYVTVDVEGVAQELLHGGVTAVESVAGRGVHVFDLE